MAYGRVSLLSDLTAKSLWECRSERETEMSENQGKEALLTLTEDLLTLTELQSEESLLNIQQII